MHACMWPRAAPGPAGICTCAKLMAGVSTSNTVRSKSRTLSLSVVGASQCRSSSGVDASLQAQASGGIQEHACVRCTPGWDRGCMQQGGPGLLPNAAVQICSQSKLSHRYHCVHTELIKGRVTSPDPRVPASACSAPCTQHTHNRTLALPTHCKSKTSGFKSRPYKFRPQHQLHSCKEFDGAFHRQQRTLTRSVLYTHHAMKDQ